MVARIEVEVDEGVLREAATIFEAIGMDVPTAINVFLRRVIMERGLPMSMVAPPTTPKRTPVDEFEPHRSNQKITRQMVDEVWAAFLRHLREQIEIGRLADDVASNTGMNRSSAFIYLYILSNLVKGEYNKRALKFSDLEYLMKRIKTELGHQAFANAIESLRQSVPYWREKLSGSFADKVEAYCDAAS